MQFVRFTSQCYDNLPFKVLRDTFQLFSYDREKESETVILTFEVLEKRLVELEQDLSIIFRRTLFDQRESERKETGEIESKENQQQQQQTGDIRRHLKHHFSPLFLFRVLSPSQLRNTHTQTYRCKGILSAETSLFPLFFFSFSFSLSVLCALRSFQSLTKYRWHLCGLTTVSKGTEMSNRSFIEGRVHRRNPSRLAPSFLFFSFSFSPFCSRLKLDIHTWSNIHA